MVYGIISQLASKAQVSPKNVAILCVATYNVVQKITTIDTVLGFSFFEAYIDQITASRGPIHSFLRGTKLSMAYRVVVPARQATYIGWRAGTPTLCHSRLYPPVGSMNLATEHGP
jgi:hypothetical protein